MTRPRAVALAFLVSSVAMLASAAAAEADWVLRVHDGRARWIHQELSPAHATALPKPVRARIANRTPFGDLPATSPLDAASRAEVDAALATARGVRDGLQAARHSLSSVA